MGRSRGGLTTKLHALVDADGRPVSLRLTGGQVDDACEAEALIEAVPEAVYDPAIHESQDGVTPSETDANRMPEAYIAHAFPGASYKEVRAHARASLALALNLQHRRTATRQLAALCVEATASTTAVISIIARMGAN